MLLPSLLTLMLLVSVGWRPASAQGAIPPGCGGVFSATSRGGASTAVGGGGCNVSGGTRDDQVEVLRVIDGDTIVVDGGRRVRYVGIDTPEVGASPEPFGTEATSFNATLVTGRMVTLKRDVSERDRFGRLLRFVYADGILVNAELVREGYARAREYPPDTQHAECYALLEVEAVAAERGMWGRR